MIPRRQESCLYRPGSLHPVNYLWATSEDTGTPPSLSLYLSLPPSVLSSLSSLLKPAAYGRERYNMTDRGPCDLPASDTRDSREDPRSVPVLLLSASAEVDSVSEPLPNSHTNSEHL